MNLYTHRAQVRAKSEQGWDQADLKALVAAPGIIDAATNLYQVLVDLFRHGVYDDPDQGLLYDTQLLLFGATKNRDRVLSAHSSVCKPLEELLADLSCNPN